MRIVLLALFVAAAAVEHNGPYLATGVKIGEVTDTSAIVWTRLTSTKDRIAEGGPNPIVKYRDPRTGETSEEDTGRNRAPVVEFPNGVTVDELDGAAPGHAGQMRVAYREQGLREWTETGWQSVDSQRDFTNQIKLENLKANTRYELRVDARAMDGTSPLSSISARFKTAPAKNATVPVTFTVTTGTEYNDKDAPDGFRMYAAMLKLNPDFFVHTGDILYYDVLAKSLPLARWHWQRMYSLPTNVEFHKQVPSYFIKDDHDTWQNDCWPTMESKFMGDFTFAQGQAVFLEQVPMGEKTYRTVRWGKDLQVWFVEGRDFRSPNDMPDGPDKTIWGKEQKEWFKRTVSESDAAFRVLVSPTPIVGPDRSAKNDNHANAGFKHEGDELRAFMAAQRNMVVVCGDRHWQYVSVDPVTGLREYSCGPASDAHAGGWPKDDKRPEHKYLNVIGGFLSVTVNREDEKPVLAAQHYSVDGIMLNEDRFDTGQ
ncbi:MAG: alkaline phosphatase D family protein [Candidatus Hydrogenedentes bacterium]|nr:alkaline phosphatase D family protein [Candidatus Hydrogenedentota bacterium]